MFGESKTKALWVKKYISEKEWRDEYINLDSYYCLGKNEDKKKYKIKIGFLVANPIVDGKFEYEKGNLPADCEPLSDEEASDLDRQRRNLRHYPFVTSDL